jgi:hypothetical protein
LLLAFAARYSPMTTFHFPRGSMLSPVSETALSRPLTPAGLACTFEIDILRMASIHDDECAFCVVCL